MNRAQKAYDAYKSITSSPYDRANSAKLAILYTIECRAMKDADYKRELEAFTVPDGTGMNVFEAIETFFGNYNTLHGVDIRDSLTPFDNPDFPEGLYFVVKTYRNTNGVLTECAPHSFKAGEEAVFRASVYNLITDEETSVPLIKYYCFSEGGSEVSGEVKNASTVEFTVSCNRPGAVRAKIDACDADGNRISGSESAQPGAVFSFTELKTTKPTPDDIESFWRGEAERLKKTLPTDTTVTKYNGSVVYSHNVVDTNYYHIKKADGAYMELLRSKRLTTQPNEILDSFDLWEFSLKCPGPCPATGYVSVPKGKDPASLPMRYIYAGYSAHAPQPFFWKDAIGVYSTHHGYPCAVSDEECYNELNGKGILGSYGRGNGKPNSLFDDPHDCYNLYIHLRNLQALRFFTDKELSSDIPQVYGCWNGNVEFTGGSLGGYQVLGICALVGFLDGKINVTEGEASVPAFCNYAGTLDQRLPNSFDLHWVKNAEYFDAAHMATLVNVPMNISRNSFGDELCVCSGICMAYNNFKGKKEMHFLQNSSHGYRPKAESQLWYECRE